MPQNPHVFVSYSHHSDAHKARVAELARALEDRNCSVVLDQNHEAHLPHWPRWCMEQTDKSVTDFILCVCTAEYEKRISGKEAGAVGQGVHWEGTLFIAEIYDDRHNSRLIPVLLDEEPGTSVPRFLSGWTRCAIRAFDESDAGFALLLRIVRRAQALVRSDCNDLNFKPSVDYGHVPPHAAAELIGRQPELAALDAAWASAGAIRLLTLIAAGGTGKTALVLHWLKTLDAQDWRGAGRVFGWSFYSQGTSEDRQASEDGFLRAALEFFGVQLAADASADEKGRKLAEAVAASRTLLVLDGLEPLQAPQGGGLSRAPGVSALLAALVRNGQPGLCVLTSRQALPEFVDQLRTAAQPQGRVVKIDLDNLSPADGARLLHRQGVTRAGSAPIPAADDAELQTASAHFKNHALTLTVLGHYLASAHGGDVRRWHEVDLAAADPEFTFDPDGEYGHAFKAMYAYERWLATDKRKGTKKLAVLRLLGLFDRPATPDCLRALREPPIPGLTDGLAGISETDWNLLIADLETAGLVQTAEWRPGKVEGYDDREMAERWMEAKSKYEAWPLDPPQAFTPPGPPLPAGARSLDAHPLLREYFARRLHEQAAEAARAGHARLYEHLCASVPYWPEGEAGLAPLYQAVAHGCRAGRYQEACAEVYRDRIHRRDEVYAIKKLGLYGASLAMLSGFFAPPWRAPVTALAEDAREWLLTVAAYLLRAFGRLHEAVELMQADLQVRIAQQNWQQAAGAANNLSELHLTLGDMPSARDAAACAVRYADKSDDAFLHLMTRTAHADALLQAGEPAAARALCAEAEALQRQWRPRYPWLYSLRGFQYCDALLLGVERAAWAVAGGAQPAAATVVQRLAEVQAVAQRAAQTLAWAQAAGDLLSIGLDLLTLARAALYRAWLLAGAEPEAAAATAAEATHAAGQAVETLRKAGSDHHIPRALLTRACVHALHGDESAARADLDAAERIARRGGMRLYLADVHLHRARLFHDPAELAAARTRINATGYERRRGELDDATAVLAGRAVGLPDEEDVLPFIRGENLPEPPAPPSPP